MARNSQVNVGIKFKSDTKEVENSLSKLKKSLQDLQKIKLSDFKGSAKDLDQMQQTAKKVQIALEKAFNPTLNTTNVKTFQSELQKTVGSIDQVYNKLKLAGPQGEVAFHQMATEVLTTNLKLKETNSLIDSMGRTMVNTVKWGIASSIMNTFTQSVQGAFQYVQSLEKSLTNIRIVTGDSTEKMAQFAEQANRSAQALGRSTLDYTKASLTFYQQGLNEEDVQARTEATLKAQNITGAGSQMADYLTAVWNGYKVANEEAEVYVDKLAAVADSSASDMSQLAIAMSKVASTANTMGVDVDQLNAQIATVVATTRQAPESVGTAFKTIYTRMNDIKAGSDEAEISLGRYSGKMAELGFNVLDATGNLRDTGQVMEEIGDRWEDLTREQQVYLAQTMGGQRQVNQLMALFDNWTTYSELLNTSLESEGTLAEKNSRYMESLGAKMEQLGAAGERVKDALINENELKGGVQALTNLVNLMGNFIESIGGGSTALLAFGSLATQVFQDTIARQINNVISNIQDRKNNDLIKQQDIEKTELFGKSEGYDREVITKLVDNKKAIQDYYNIMSQGEVNAYNNIIKTVAAQEQQTVALQKSKDAGEQFKSYLAQIPGVAKQLQKDLGSTAETFSMKAREAGEVITQNWSFKKIRQDSEGFVQSITTAFDDLGKSFGGMQAFQNMNSFKGFKQAYNDIMYLQDGIEPTQEQLETLFTTWRNFTKELTIQTGNVAILDETNSKLELSKAKLQVATNEAENFRNKIQQLAMVRSFVGFVSGLGQIASGIKSIINLNKIWQNENLSTGQKLLQTFTNLSMTIGLFANGFSKSIDGFNRLKKAAGELQTIVENFATARKIAAAEEAGAVNLQLLSQEELQAAYAETGVKAWLSLGPYAAIIIGIAAAIGLVVAAYKDWNKEADAAKKASEVAADSKKTYDDLKTSLQDVKSALEDLHSAEDNLDGLTKGTQEWRDALQECNDKVLELISNYPELAQYVTNENGQLKLSAAGEQEYLEKKRQGVQNARNAASVAASASRQASAIATAADIGHKSVYGNGTSGQSGGMASATDVRTVVQAIDKVIGQGSPLPANLESLSGAIADYTKLSESEVSAILANREAVLSLKGQLEQNEAADKVMYQAMASNGLQDNSTYKGLNDIGKQVASAIAGSDLEKRTEDIRKDLINQMSGLNMSRFTSGSDSSVQDILKRLNDAQQTNWTMSSNAVRGGEGNRTLAFLDEQGELHQFTREQIASTIAASQALQGLGTSAETVAEMLKNIDNLDISGDAKDAVKQWVSGQDITGVTQRGLEELKTQDITEILGEKGTQALAEQWDLLKEDGTADIDALKERWTASCNDMASSFVNVTKDASRSVKEAFNEINTDDVTLGTQQEIVGSMQQTFNKGGSKALGQLTELYESLEDKNPEDGISALDTFSNTVKDFDFNTGTVQDFRQALKEAGVETNASTQAIQAYINAQKQASGLSSEENYKNIHDITDNLKRNDTIDAQQADTLRAAGVNLKAFFTLTADGSYKLKADAEVFQEYINGITIEPFKARMDQLQEKIDSIHAFDQGGEFARFSSQNMDIDEFSSNAGSLKHMGQGAWEVQTQDTDKLKAQIQYLKIIGVEDAAIQQVEKDIDAGRNTSVQNLQRISSLVKQNAQYYDNLSEKEKQYLEEMSQRESQIVDANDRGLDADVDEEKWENLSEHLQEYADQIDEVSDQLKNNAEVADDLAQAILRYDSAIGEVQKNYDNWLEALTSGSIEDQVQAVEDLENAYSDLLDLPFDNILSADFLQNVDNLNLLKQAANGSEQAYNQLMQAAQQDIMTHVGIDDESLSQFNTDLATIENQIDAGIDDLQIGAFVDDTQAIQAMNQLINAADMTAAQATDLLASMGVDAEVESIQVPENQKQALIDAQPSISHTPVQVPTIVQDNLGGTTVSETTVQVPSINYNPITDVAEQQGQKMATVLRVKSARKSSGGGFKYKNSSAGNKGSGGKGGGGKKGGGGGSGKAKEPNKAKGATNKADRYRNNTVKANKLANSMTKLQKQQERLTGKDSLKNLQKQLQILKKQNDTIRERIGLQRDEQSELANNLKKFGATFDKDGTLNNYFKVHAKIMQQYNNQVAKWNKMSAKQQQKNKDMLNNAKEVMDNALKDLQRYDKLQQEIAKSIQQQIDNAQAQIDLKVKQFEIKINAELDLSKAKRDWNEFKRNVIDEVREDDILGLNDYRFTDISTYFNNDKTGTIQVLTQQLKKIMGDQGNDIFSAQYFSEKIGEMSITDRQVKLKQIKNLFDSLKDEMEGVKQLADEIRDSVFDSIDALQEIYEEEMDEYEFIGDVLNHNMKIIESMYGDQAYDKMAKYYDKIEENNNRQLKALSIQRDNWYNLMKTTEQDMQGLDPNSNRYQDLDKKRKEYEKLWKDTSKDFQSLTEDTLDNVMDKYANTINNILLNFDLSLGGGKALDDIADEWDMLNDLADTYLDKINSAYEIEKLQNAFDDAINDNEGNIAAQQSLNNLMEQQLTYLKDKEKLTQYDIDRANTLLQIEMKRLALEQSRNNKNRLRLRRDSQGNYTYQYTADTEAMNKAEQELADARNSLYNSDKAAYVDNLSAIQKSASDLEDKLKDVWNDSNLDYEQKLQKQYELQKYYGQKINDLVAENTSIRNNLMDSAFEELAKMYNISPDQFKAMSKEEQDKIFKDIIPQANSYTTQMVDNILGAGGISKFLEDVANAAKVANDDKSAAIGQIQNEIIDSTDVLIEQSEHLLDNNKQLLDLRQKQLEATQQDLYLLSTFLDQYSSNSKDSAINVLKTAYEVIANNEREILGISQKVDKNTANNQKASMEQATKQWTLKNFADAERNAIISKNSFEINTKTLEAIDKINQEYNNDLLSARNDLLSIINNSNTNDLFGTIDNNIFNSINSILNNILETSQEYYATSLAKQDAIRQAIVANQTIHIDADFPNAKDVRNIIEAIEGLANAAAQRVNTKGI